MLTIIEKAQKEISETGCLSVAARQQLWLALGPAEVNEQHPGPLTEAVRKRAQLALACGKKVSRVWSAYDAEDKRPQALLRKISAYLEGKCTAEQLDQLLSKTDFMSLIDEERYSNAPLAALAAWNGAVTALYDEPLLSPDRIGCSEEDLDFYDWDAAWCAAVAWAGRDEDASTGKQRVEEMKFWAWYLEQAAVLLGEEGYRFPKKEIRRFQEQQEPPRPVPEQADLEDFVRYMGLGELLYCAWQARDHCYVIWTVKRSMKARCPECGAEITQPKFWYGGNYLDDAFPNNGPAIRLLVKIPWLSCPDHPDANCRIIEEESINVKAAWKRYLAVPGRPKEFLEELKRRRVNSYNIGESFTSLNEQTDYHHCQLIPPDIQGIRWIDPEMEEMEIHLAAFGPYVYFQNHTLEEYCRCYPDRVQTEEDGTLLLTMDRHWVRCERNGNGALTRVILRSRFMVRFDRNAEAAVKAKLLHENQSAALGEVLGCSDREVVRMLWEELRSRLSGLTRPQALAAQKKLRDNGLLCDLLPIPRRV